MNRFVHVVPYTNTIHNAFGHQGRPVINLLLGRKATGPWDAFKALPAAVGTSKACVGGQALSLATAGLLGSSNVLASNLREQGLWIDVETGTFILLKIKPSNELICAFELEMKALPGSERPVDSLTWAELPFSGDGLPEISTGQLSPLLTLHMPALGKYLHQKERQFGRFTWADTAVSTFFIFGSI
jgi:hypothetical protein